MVIYRNILRSVRKHLEKKQITLVIGARQVGKTTLLKTLAKQLDEEDLINYFISMEDPLILKECNKHPENLFQILPSLNTNIVNYIFIDEIQYLENPSNFLKYIYDMHSDHIKLIASGSSSFYIDQKFKDSLAGRKRVFKLHTVSFDELVRLKLPNSIHNTHTGKPISLFEKRELESLLDEYLVFGGYPEVILENDTNEKIAILSELKNSYVKKDAIESGLEKVHKYMLLMQLLAEQIGNLLNTNELASTLKMNRLTIDSYIKTMCISNHVCLIRPFFTNLRKELTKMPKVYFNDLGLRNSFVKDFSPPLLRKDKGALLEQYYFRRFYEKHGVDSINYWRTANKNEVDFIIDGKNAFEVKYSCQSFKRLKYKVFEKMYPDIPLECLSRDNILTFEI